MYSLIVLLTTVGLMAANFTIGSQAQGVRVGNVYIPASSIEHPRDIGVRAHTCFEIYVGPRGGKGAPGGGNGPAGAMTPQQIRQFYNLPSTGGSQIIAIVDAYHNPNALSDFNTFATYYGLPTEPASNVMTSTNQIFQVLYADGSQPGLDPTGDWEFEESIDVQWAHAMAPNAKIVLIETTDNSYVNLLSGVDAATNFIDGNGLTPKEISCSWGGSEFSFETNYESHFTGTGAVYFACAGDDAAPGWWPSFSPNVVSAGGTLVTTDTNGNFVSEAGWSDGGGGPSQYEPIPFFQSNIGIITSNGGRGIPDLSFDSAPGSGVSVYDSNYYQNGDFVWWVAYGTSIASPSLAGIANLAATVQGPFPAGSQALLSTIYSNLGSNNFRDITSGNN